MPRKTKRTRFSDRSDRPVSARSFDPEMSRMDKIAHDANLEKSWRPRRTTKKPTRETVLRAFASELAKIPSGKEAANAGNEVLERLAPFKHDRHGQLIPNPRTLELRRWMNDVMYQTPEGNELISTHKYPDPESLPDLFRSYGPGKFDNYATAELYEEGEFDEECGEADTTNWYGLVKGPFHHPQLRQYAGAILEENSQGFVYSEFYDTEEKLMQTWSRIEYDVGDQLGSEADLEENE
jgi:hypothetical protein